MPSTADYFAGIVNASPDCIRILDLNGRVEFMNERGQALLEIQNFEANRGRVWADLWPEGARERVQEAVAGALSGQTRSFRAYCPTAAGKPKWWDTVVAPVLSDGRVLRLVATSRDVTNERETRLLLDTITRNVPAALFAKDAASGEITWLNRATEELFGQPASQIVGKTDYDLVPAEQADFYRECDQAAVATGCMQVIEEEPFTQPDGEVRYLRTKKIAASDEHGATHIIAISEDVTAEKKAGEALREALVRAEAANDAKGEFLANMSHEIRTPLNGVIAVAEAMAQTRLDAAQQEMLSIIRESGETLTKLLSDILDLAKVEAGHLEIEETPFELAEAARLAAGLAELEARSKGLTFRSVIDLPPTTVLGDAARLKQILVNLLSNAVKFTEAGEVRFEVGLQRQSDHLVARFEVHDTGIGLSEADKARIFSRFEQADGAITRRFGGTGLGLAIAHELATLMNGKLEAAGKPGHGSTFSLELPLKPAPPAMTETPSEEAFTSNGGDSSSRPLKILIAEDHPTNRRILELFLEPTGAVLTVAEDGEAAVKAWEQRDFDIVLMDMQMPVMDGVTATRLIRQREAARGSRRTPIVFVSANAMATHIETGLEAGGDAYLTKPITAKALWSSLREALERCQEIGDDARQRSPDLMCA